MAKSKEEKKSIEQVLKELDKEFGEGSVITGNDTVSYTDVVSTGSLSLDIATGIGGLPVDGKIIEVYGWESSGKSTLVQTIIGNYQKKKTGKKALLVDGEFSLDSNYATNLDVDLNDLLLIQLDEHAGEGAYNKAQKLIETGEIGLVIYDSYNSLQPKKIIDGDIGDHNIGLHARMMGQAVQKANNNAVKYGTTSIFVGQLREKIGVMFGSPDVTQGGNALKFYAHMRLKVSRSLTTENSITENKEKVGNLTKVSVEKNKLAPPFKKAEFNIRYGQGIDKQNELIDVGHEVGVFKKYGESITLLDVGDKLKIVDFIELLKNNDEMFNNYRQQCLNRTIFKNKLFEPKIEEIKNETQD